MIQHDMNPSTGVFDPSVVRDLVEAFDRARRHLDRLRGTGLPEIDRTRLARRILVEARSGETEPDLVWRAAVARILLEARAEASQSAADLPLAGPHAQAHHTNEAGTPGAGALPSEPFGDDVDPGTG